jgi:hypothetical protein
MVASGTIYVDVVKNGTTYHLQKVVTVLPRGGWFTPTPSSVQVPNGFDPITHPALDLNDPPFHNDPKGFGKSEVITPVNYKLSPVPYGPNAGYYFVSSRITPFQYLWTGAQTILDVNSPTHPAFAAANCGSYPSNPLGFATASQIRDSLIRHESGQIESHYMNFVVAMNTPTLNPAAVLEPMVKKTSEAQFANEVKATLLSALNGIHTKTEVEPCGGQDSLFVTDPACNNLGRRNFLSAPNGSYAACP